MYTGAIGIIVGHPLDTVKVHKTIILAIITKAILDSITNTRSEWKND